MGKLTDKYADAVYQATQKPKVVSPTLNPYNQQPINQVQSTVKPLTSVVSKSVPQVTQAVKSFVTAPLDVTGAKKADQADLSKSATYFGEAGIVQPLKSVARTVQAIPSAITLGTSIKPEEQKNTVTIAGTEISTKTPTYDPYNQSEQYRNIKSSLENQYGTYDNMPENTKAIYENVVNSILTVNNFGKTFDEQITNIQNEYADKPIPSFMQEKLDVLQDQQLEYTAKVDNARQKLIDLQNQNIQELTDIQEKYQDVQLLTGTEYASKVSSTIIQMTPYILASYAGGGIGGAVLGSTLGSTAMYATVYTNASAQALQEGATDEQANTYAHMSALIETGTEALFGGVVGAPKGILSEGVAGMIEKGLLKSTTNGTAQILIKKAVDVFGEGAEEYLAEYLGSMAMSIYTQDERSLQELNQDAIDSFIMGAITSGVMQVGRVGAVRAIESLVTDKQVDVENIPLQQANEVMNAIVTRAGVATSEGLSYRVENLPANEKGYYDASTREIVLNKKEVDQYGLIDTALPHEMTHALEGTKAYQEMADFILQSKQEEFDVTVQELRELYQAKFDQVHEQQLALGNTNHTLEIATNETMAREMIAEYIRNNFASRPMKDAQGNIMRDSNGQIILYRDYNALLDLAKKPTIVSALKKTLQNFVLKSKLADAQGTNKEAFLQAQAYFESLDTFLSNALKNAPQQAETRLETQVAYQLTKEQVNSIKPIMQNDETEFKNLVNNKDIVNVLSNQEFNSDTIEKDLQNLWIESKIEKANLTDLSLDQSQRDLFDVLPQNYYDGWFRNADSDYKPIIIQLVLGSDKGYNASLNIFRNMYNKINNTNLSMNEFLNTEITLYRGEKKTINRTEHDIFVAYSMDKTISNKFARNGGVVNEIKVTPLETLGMFNTIGEQEVLVPEYIEQEKLTGIQNVISQLDLNKNIISENNDNGIRVINEYETEDRKFNDTLEDAQNLLIFSDNKGYGYNSVQYGDEVYTKDVQIDYKEPIENLSTDVQGNLTTTQQEQDFTVRENGQLKVFYYNENGISENALNYGYFLNESSQGLDDVKKVYVNANVVDANGFELQEIDLSKYNVDSDMTNAEIIKSVGDRYGIEEVKNLLNEITQSTGINALQFDNSLMVFNEEQYSNVPERVFRDDVAKIEYKKVGNKYQINEYNEYNDLIHSELMTQDEVIENVGQFAEKVLTNATNKFNVSDAKPDNSKVTTQQVEFLSDSAIKNEDGSPKHVYHGSPNVFESFSYQNMGRTGLVDGVGFYFTDNKEFASGFSGETGKVYDVFLNIKKPTDETSLTITKEQLKEIMLDIDSKFDGDFLNNYDDVSRLGKEKVVNNAVNEILNNNTNDKDIINSLMDTVIYNSDSFEPILRSVMDKTGIDGFVINKDYGTLYIPFVPEQIVSTTNPIPQAEPTTEKIAYNNSINQVTITDTPTQTEYKALESYFNSASLRDGANIYVNVSSLNGATDGKIYTIANTGEQIVKDIKYFYKNDRLPQRQYSLEQEREATRSYQETTMRGNIRQEDAETLLKDVQAGKYNYTVIGDEGSVQRANDRIKTQGVDNALNEFNVKFDTNLRFSKDDAVVAMILVNKLSAQGRVNEFKDLVSKMAILNTESGQFIQAGTLIKKLDPAGQLMTLTKSLDRINRKIADKGKRNQAPLTVPQQYQDFFIEAQGKLEQLEEQRTQFEQQQIELENTQREIDSLVLSGVGEELGTLQTELNELRDLQKEQNALERKLVLLNEKLSMYSNENLEFLESDVQETKARVQEYQSRLNEINKNIKRFNELETILESISGVSQRDLNAIKNKYKNITQSNKAYARLFGKLEGLTGVDVAKINEMKASVKELEKAQRALQKLIDKNERFTSQENINEVMDETKIEIAKQLEATKMDKLNAWRYLSMLGNPRTHIRNILGNTAMIPLVMGKNVVATIAQQTLPQEQRTKSLFASKEAKEFAQKDFIEHMEMILGDGKYTVEGEIAKNKRIFNNLALEWARTANSNLLEKEDEVFAGFHYRNALASYLTAQKVDFNNINEETLNKARDYAIQEARKATFRDASQFASKLSEIQRKGGVAGLALDAVIPFKKTPINIIRRGVEYSPIGLFKSLAQEGYNLATGRTTNTTEFIENLSAGLTGTGIAVLGIMAYAMGMLELGGDDDETKRLSYLESAMGRQRYSINILGGTYTIDWLSPAVMPFIVGAEMAQSYMSGNEESVLNNGWDSLLNIMDPVFELTMLQGVTNTLSSFSGGGVAMAGEATKEMIANYVNQFVPTLSGQIARTIDPIQRSTLSGKQGIEKWLETTARKLANKIPFATFLNAPVVNVKGEIISNDANPFIRAFNNLANPGYFKDTNVSSIDKEILRLYDISNESGVLPRIAPKSITVDGEKTTFTNEQYSQFQQTQGQLSYEMMRELIDSPEYYGKSDSTKMDLLEDIYEYAYQTAKEEALGSNNDSWYLKVKSAEIKGYSANEYLLLKDYYDNIRLDDNSDNKGQFIDYLIRQGYLSKKNELLEMFGWKADSIEINGLESLTKLTDTIQIEGLTKLD